MNENGVILLTNVFIIFFFNVGKENSIQTKHKQESARWFPECANAETPVSSLTLSAALCLCVGRSGVQALSPPLFLVVLLLGCYWIQLKSSSQWVGLEICSP